MNVEKEAKAIVIILAILAIAWTVLIFTFEHVVCTSPDKDTVITTEME